MDYVLFSPSPWMSHYYKLSFLTFDILLTGLPVFIFATSFQIHFPLNIQSDLGKQKFSSVTVIYFKQFSYSSLLSWWRPKSLLRSTSSNLFLFVQIPFPFCSLFFWTPVSLDFSVFQVDPLSSCHRAFAHSFLCLEHYSNSQLYQIQIHIFIYL